MTHTASHIVINFMEKPVGGKTSPVKVRDCLCLLFGGVLGFWLG